jgi:hypothetical protein
LGLEVLKFSFNLAGENHASYRKFPQQDHAFSFQPLILRSFDSQISVKRFFFERLNVKLKAEPSRL